MTNPTDLHDIIFVTDKYGRRNKTGDIEKLQYDSRKDVYFITYKDGKTYPCRRADGESVLYANADMIRQTLEYDFSQEKVFDYSKLSKGYCHIKYNEKVAINTPKSSDIILNSLKENASI